MYTDICNIVFTNTTIAQLSVCTYFAVDPLLLQCETGGSSTQVRIDCKVNRPLVGVFCSFDGSHQHKCESTTRLRLLVYKLSIVASKPCIFKDTKTYACNVQITALLNVTLSTGEWPMVINVQSGLSAGNHSVVISATDTIGLTTNTTVNYILEEEEQAKQNRMDM